MLQFIARLFLRLTGWKAEGNLPAARRYVLLSAPHTSNWDLVYLLAIGFHLGVKISFMAKHQLFVWPLGPFMRWAGGIPVHRDRRANRVEQMTERLQAAPRLALAVPAEGTRTYVPHWKSGFYHIALAARVPIVFGYLDYARKCGGVGPEMIPTGKLSEDMETIRDFYSDVHAKYPECVGEIRLKEEM